MSVKSGSDASLLGAWSNQEEKKRTRHTLQHDALSLYKFDSIQFDTSFCCIMRGWFLVMIYSHITSFSELVMFQ
jgi:hypothetical protein